VPRFSILLQRSRNPSPVRLLFKGLDPDRHLPFPDDSWEFLVVRDNMQWAWRLNQTRKCQHVVPAAGSQIFVGPLQLVSSSSKVLIVR
jgi:hypothetical protein